MGLINGEPWREIRALLNEPFVHRTVAETIPFFMHAAEQYLFQIEHKDTHVVELRAASSFSRFPFLTTAEYIYGPMEEFEKEDLWSLGQQSLALMGKVLTGGIFRLEACRWLKPQVHKQLTEFEKNWMAFNEQIVQRRRASGQLSSAVVQAWEAIDGGKVSKKEVSETTIERLSSH